MKPPAFKYFAAESVEEAVSILAQHGDEAKVIAGGQSLVPMLNFRLLSPSVIVDINAIPGLDQIEDYNGGLKIGALTRHFSLETSQAVSKRFPVLSAAMIHVAHLAIRNRGTIGGSLSHADPAAELPTIAVLLDAKITVARSGGERVIDARGFFESALNSALEDDEIVTQIEFPALPARTGWGFHEFTRRSGDFGLAGVAVTMTQSGKNATNVRIALLGVDETPIRATEAESLLNGNEYSMDGVRAAVEIVRDSIEPNNDLHASADYRRHLVGILTERALTSAWRRASSLN